MLGAGLTAGAVDPPLPAVVVATPPAPAVRPEDVGRRFFFLAISGLESFRPAQRLGTPGYLNSTGSTLSRAARRPRVTMTTTPIRVMTKAYTNRAVVRPAVPKSLSNAN